MKKAFEVPTGKWKHLKKSYVWEQYNENNAKNLVGEFGTEAQYLVWKSDDARETFFMDVKTFRLTEKDLYVEHRSGLGYWFAKEGV